MLIKMLKQIGFGVRLTFLPFSICLIVSCGGTVDPDSNNSSSGALPAALNLEKSDCDDPGLPFEPGKIQRLTPSEYQNSVQDLLGVKYDAKKLFPVDKEAHSFRHSIYVTDAHSEEYQNAAEAIAEAAVKKVNAVLGCDLIKNGGGPNTVDEACVKGFIDSFVNRAFRKQASSELLNDLYDLFVEEKELSSPKEGVQAIIEVVLQSPYFLYRNYSSGLQNNLDLNVLASRLSYLLLGTTPDAQLLELAENGELAKPAVLRSQVDRILATDASRRHIAEQFFARWLEVDHISSDRDDLSEETRSATVEAAIQYIVDHAWQEGGVETLLTAKTLTVNSGMAELNLSAANGTTDDENRVGILSQPAWLINHASSAETAPINRGIFIREGLLCQGVPTLPEGEVMFPEPEVGVSMRQRLEAHREDPGCAVCHRVFDPMGLAFENFDNKGHFRLEEWVGQPIDASGEIGGLTGGPYSFVDARELMDLIVDSPELRQCVARKWFKYAYRQVAKDTQMSCREKELAEALALPNGFATFISAVASYTSFLHEK